MLKYNSKLTINSISDLFINNPRLIHIYLYNSPEEKIEYTKQGIKKPIIFLRNQLSNNSCGQIHSDYFAINIQTFTESQNYNTCLNRKISIDVNGEIKNCPSMQKSYGNIKNTTLAGAIEKPGFKDLWYIKKDDIEVCKDCEFHYMCTDCRAFIKDPNNIYSQPAKCSYNPYIAKWEGEEGYISVEEWRKMNKIFS